MLPIQGVSFMKKMFIAALALAISSVHAEELMFGDLNFFVPGQRFILSADANHATYKESFAGDIAENEHYDLNARLNYGLSDTFNLFAGLGYNFQDDTDLGKGDDVSSDGLENPFV